MRGPEGYVGDVRQIGDTYLKQLARLVSLRHEYREGLNPLGVQLLNRAIMTRVSELRDLARHDEVVMIINSPQRKSV